MNFLIGAEVLFIKSIISWHKRIFQNPWFTQKTTIMTIVISLILCVSASYMNFQARHINWETWNQDKEQFFVGDIPLFTTMDAGFFLGIAGYLKSGKTFEEFQNLRVFPLNQENTENSKLSEQSVPLLSEIIAYLASDTSPESLLVAANKMIPYTAVITVIAIFTAFAVTGYWLEASVAAAGGGLSIAYYWRSSIGRIDTDQLNLGFFYFLFAMVFCASKAKNMMYGLLFTTIAGVTANFFMRWYGKSELVIMAALALFWLLCLISRDWRRVCGFTILFITISGAGYINPFNSIYMQSSLEFDNFIFSNLISTVTEASRANIPEILFRMTGSVLFSIICLLGILLWAMRHPVIAVAYAPLAGFFVLNIFIGNRAAFYSAPFFWFGGAYLVILITKMSLFHVTSRFPNITHNVTTIFSSAVCVMLLILIWLTGPAYQLTKPSIPAPIIKALLYLNDGYLNSEQNVVASWWDYGYASMFLNGLPTFVDPGAHGAKANYFIANTLLTDNQLFAADTLRFLGRGGIDKLNEPVANSNELKNKIFLDRKIPTPNVYFMLTSQMTDWMPSISKVGKWDIDLGAPMHIEGQKIGQPLSYNFVSCSDTIKSGIVNCNNSTIDLNAGMIDGKPVLDLVVEARGGRIVGSRRYKQNALNMFQIMKDIDGNSSRVSIMHKDLFLSTYNQMFHLGNYDTKNFRLIYDGYPHVRIFKLLPAS